MNKGNNMKWYKDNEFVNLSDDDLLEEYDDARNLMSYYNAAEGNWSSETGARNECSSYLGTVRSEIDVRNLTPNAGTFLC